MTLINFQGKIPRVQDACFIAPDADIIGEVSLGKDSGIWFKTVLRGDIGAISIGEKTNIQDGCIVHVESIYPTRIGNYVTVGHGVILHGCTIGDRCLIGMGSIILDGAEIGEECLIGAGSLVTRNKKIPPRSLALGVPAKVAGQVTEEQVRSLIRQAEVYAERGKTMKNCDTSNR